MLKRSFLFFPLLFLSFSFAFGKGEELGKGFSQVAKKTMPAVVFIKSQENAQMPPPKSSQEYGDPFEYFNERFRHFFEDTGPKIVQGSGFIVSKDGYVLTNFHLVKNADEITVVMNDGQEFPAKVIGSDQRTDLSVIKIDGKEFPFLNMGDSDTLDIGEWVVAIGNPFALQSTLTVGVVSAKGRQDLHINEYEEFIQTDAAINPGNSGGPLLNLEGDVVGINTAIFSRSGGSMGIGFAIPSNMAKHVMNQIIQSGAVNRGYLGVLLQVIDKDIAEGFSLPKAEGALIAEVIKESAADKAGLKEGDIIVEYNGKPVKAMKTFRNDISLLKPGSKVALMILREGKKIPISVQLEKNPQEALAANQPSQLGIEVKEVKDISPQILQNWGYTDLKEGVLVSGVKPGSIAAKAGIVPGMLLLQVNQAHIKKGEDFAKAMEQAKDKQHLLLHIRYHQLTKFISLKMK